MVEITYKDRKTGELKKEKVYGKFFLEVLYGSSHLAELFSMLLLPIISSIPFFSNFYGRKQKSKKSRLKILPFIRDFKVDVSEFADSSINIYSRLWCKQSDYWDIIFSSNKKIYEEFAKNNINIPFPQRDVHVYDIKK